MAQLTLSYVVGCAGSDIVTTLFASLGATPSIDILLRNLLLCLCLTILVATWIGTTGIEYALLLTSYFVLLTSYSSLLTSYDTWIGTTGTEYALSDAHSREAALTLTLYPNPHPHPHPHPLP